MKPKAKPQPQPTSIRLPADLKQAIKVAAKRDDRSFNSYIVHALRVAVADKR